MLIDQKYLFTPGPTPIPDRVKHAMNHPMIAHRGNDFPMLLDEVSSRISPVFGTENPVYLLAASGTAALETAVANTIEENNEVIVIVTGVFGERFASICEAFGANVHRLYVEWGKICYPEQLETFIKSINKKIKAVFATYCETSTGVLNPIKDFGKITKGLSDALFIVDGVSCIGAVPIDMAGWNIDILVSGSQKALMLPPGLAFIAISPKARIAIENCKSKRFYFDLNRYIASHEKERSTPFTPAVSLIFGALEVCRMIEEEGIEQVIKRHQLIKMMVREGLKALELPLLASDEDSSPTVTAVVTNNAKTKQIKKILEERFSIILAGGQKSLKGEIFRIGHMGYCTPFDALKILSSIEMALHSLGNLDALGTATSKAQEVWLNHV